MCKFLLRIECNCAYLRMEQLCSKTHGTVNVSFQIIDMDMTISIAQKDESAMVTTALCC